MPILYIPIHFHISIYVLNSTPGDFIVQVWLRLVDSMISLEMFVLFIRSCDLFENYVFPFKIQIIPMKTQ